MAFKDTVFSQKHLINLNGKLLDTSVPKIMGIINLSPDSFYAGSRKLNREELLQTVGQMLNEGADILDIGAASSRPGAKDTDVITESERYTAALDTIREKYPDVPLSLDTWRSEVASRMHERFRIEMVNDITGGDGDPGMYDFIATAQLPYVIMHKKGNPAGMQENPQYEDVVDEVLRYLADRIWILKEKGVNDVLADPGFGFGKSLEHNYSLLADLDVFRCLEVPLVAGISRKSMIWKPLNTDPSGALNGTTALHSLALMKGASILRVHDVAAAAEVIRLFKLVKNAGREDKLLTL